MRISEKRLDPGDELSVAKHRYEVQYTPLDLGAAGPPPPEDLPLDLMRKSLLERAGLEVRKRPEVRAEPGTGRYDVLNDEAGQIRDLNKPV